MISAMLSAIQDFVRDSFQAGQGESLQTLRVGDWNVWLETGPQATLAAVIRGQAPETFHTALQETLEKVHAVHAAALEVFDGDAAPFEPAREPLEHCLQIQFGEQAQPSAARFKLALAVVLALALVWGFFSVRAGLRWREYVRTLRAQPGIVVIEARKNWSGYSIAGLRDPLADDPARLLEASKIRPDKVTFRWEPYQALGPAMIVRRATLRLQPPPGVVLRFLSGALYAAGSAPRGWAETAQRRADGLPGVAAFDTSQLTDDTANSLATSSAAIEQAVLLFEEGAKLAAGSETTLDAVATRIAELQRTALADGRRVRIAITGHTDKTGSEELNLRLSRQRAESVAALLTARGVPASLFVASGVGSREAPRELPSDPGQPQNRRVTFRVTLEDAPARPAP